MTPADLASLYRRYLDCLNRRDWARLGDFVAEDATHNGRRFGLAGYRAMLEQDVLTIPDLRFEIETLASEPPTIAARLRFDCTPATDFLGLPVAGRQVVFAEHVFYRFREGRIAEVWSLLDREAIAAQCGA